MSDIHSVTVTTTLEHAGTEDEERRVQSVRLTCTAPPEAPCRTYPESCGCERFTTGADGKHDAEGHEITTGNECFLCDWFDAGAAIYVGEDFDDMRDDCVPAVEREGAITVSWSDEWPEWEFTPEPTDSDTGDTPREDAETSVH